MASGDILFPFDPSMICGPKLGYQPTASIQRVGSGNQLVAVMPKVTSAPNPCFDIKGVIPHLYSAATGLTIVMAFACDVNSGNVKINAAFERYNAAGMGLGAESFATAQTATVAVAGTANDLFAVSVALTNAQIDGLLLREGFRLRITRDASHANDTTTGPNTLYFVSGYIKET